MKRLLGTIGKRISQDSESGIPNGDSPEATVARGIGDEFLHLPVIVEAAESSPAAAREAANRIRKFLGSNNYQRAYVQYNAIMLVRILTDNPGKSFTINLDNKFASTVKELLRAGRDMSVQQILRETLDSFETSKADDETLAPLREMWKKEKEKWAKAGHAPTVQPQNYTAVNSVQQAQNYFSRNHRPRGLPPPHELSERIEEARMSSKLLLQLVQSTPPNEVLQHELIKEFVERCQSASRSVQGYINSDNPPPDEDTLLTLIETNDQISTALSRYQRAMLQARRITGASPSPGPGGLQRNGFRTASEMPVNSPPPNGNLFNPPSAPPPTNGMFSTPSAPPPQQYPDPQTQQKDVHIQQPHNLSQPPTADNPFDDPRHETNQAPLDFGLPPNHTQPHLSESAPYQPTGSGYHPPYKAPAISEPQIGPQEASTRGPSYGRRTETHVDDSDEEVEMHARGQERGQPVQYRF
ncbi:MAG: hypothetical protein LQ348_004929 [Seirophora lacunosa]|nr:MAG: hypothetical protein LQ348_004929 [Seirophora lacunosa]